MLEFQAKPKNKSTNKQTKHKNKTKNNIKERKEKHRQCNSRYLWAYPNSVAADSNSGHISDIYDSRYENVYDDHINDHAPIIHKI